MSLLTKEQKKDIADIRESNRLRHDLATGGEAMKDVEKLLSIIDDLQSRAPKQYTGQELRKEFESYGFHPSFLRVDNFKQWVHCARALGTPRQYTEQELREHYENCFSAETGEDNTWDGWLECARFLGALKAEP